MLLKCSKFSALDWIGLEFAVCLFCCIAGMQQSLARWELLSVVVSLVISCQSEWLLLSRFSIFLSTVQKSSQRSVYQQMCALFSHFNVSKCWLLCEYVIYKFLIEMRNCSNLLLFVTVSWLTGGHFLGKLYAASQPTRPTQPSIPLGSVNES